MSIEDPRNIIFENDNLRQAGNSIMGMLFEKLLILMSIVFFLGIITALCIDSAIYDYYKIIPDSQVFLGILIVFGGISIVYFRGLAKKIDDLFYGLNGEKFVASQLEDLRKYGAYIISDIPMQYDNGHKFNVDHVLISPYGVFAIETKIKLYGKYLQEAVNESSIHAYYLNKLLEGGVGEFAKSKPFVLVAKQYVKGIQKHEDEKGNIVELCNVKYFVRGFDYKNKNDIVFTEDQVHLIKSTLDKYIVDWYKKD